MKKTDEAQRGFYTRRNFLKILGISAGTLAIGPQSLVTPGFPADIYPAARITCLVPNAPGGGYDMIARGVAPYLTRHFQEIAPGAFIFGQIHLAETVDFLVEAV